VRFHVALICTLAGLPLSGCYGLYGDDQLQRYAQRIDTVTLSAGDAKEVNARTHMVAAWPRGVGDRNIPMVGTRGVRAMECYRQAGGKQQVGNASQTNINMGSGGSAGSAPETQLRGC
jgi:hypothetical protein